MTKEKFRALCEDVLAPKIAERFVTPLNELQEAVDVMAAELLRLSCALDEAIVIAKPSDNADNG
jgi:hypothetical protein